MKMKMVNSLLLGSAAGIVGVAGAQAADLPVKAKPVEYVKVCSLYGAGYYYIPGTDICSKIGGYVRMEVFQNFGSNGTTGPWVSTGSRLQQVVSTTTNFGTTSIGNAYNAGENSRGAGSADYVTRIRAYITAETRQQTQYGTLRSYLNVGVNVDNPTNQGLLAQSAGGFNANRAFIQIAGFTIGKATSYYDFYSAPATGYFAPPSSDAGDGGVIVMAYTAQLGNGLSASIGLEDPRRLIIYTTGTSNGGAAATTAAEPTQLNSNGLLAAPSTTNTYKKVVQPDYVANLRIDQAWGAAQVMGVLHDASPGPAAAPTVAGTNAAAHYGDKWGWAIGAGAKINAPMFGAGDYLQMQYNYSQGAGRYVATSLGSSNAFARNGGSFGYGFNTDGVMSANTDLQLTTAWGVNAAYEHFWTPSLRTSVYGSYMKVQYNATANAEMCAFQQGGNGNASNGTGLTAVNIAGTCTNDYSWWTLGSRSQWNVTKDFYLGVDVIYMKLNTASKGASITTAAAAGTMALGTYTIEDQSIWALRLRAHRDIVP